MKNLRGIGRIGAIALVLALFLSACARTQPTTPATSAPTTTVAPASPTATAPTTTRPATTSPTTAAPTTARPVTTAPATTPSATTAPYGELRIGVAAFETEKFDPTVVAQATMTTLLVHIFDWMINLKDAKPAPGIAERWEMAPDGLSWTFNIRKGVKFHDGTELTAKDVKFSLDRYSSQQAFYSQLRAATERVEVVDNYTVRVFTKGPQPQYLVELGAESSSTYALIIPKDYFERVGAEGFERRPVGSGPFTFVRHIPGDVVEYEALDKHWQNTPEFKKLSVINLPEENTRLAALKTGEVDMIDIGPESAPELERAGFRTPALSYMPYGVQFYHVFESAAAGMPTADVRVRQALSFAINRDEVNKSFFMGKAQPAFAPHLGPNSAYINVARWQAEIPKLYGYDVEKAKQLLKEAGYPNGFSFKLYAYTLGGAPFMPKIAEIVQGYWAKIGVKAELVPSDWGAFSRMRWTGSGKSRVATPALIGQASTMRNQERTDPIRSLAHATDGGGSWSAFGFNKPDVDKLMAAARQEFSDKKRGEIIDEIVKIESEAYVFLSMGRAPQFAALGPRVDIDFPPLASVAAQYAAIAKHRK